MEEIVALFEDGHIDLAIYLYNKHNSENPVLHSNIHQVISAIPLNAQLDHVSKWIQLQVIPYLTKNQLISLEEIIIKRAKSIESLSNYIEAYETTKIITHTPIFACRLGIPTKVTTMGNAKVRSHQDFSQYSPSDDYLAFQSKLKLLVDMKEKYGLNLSLTNDFLDDDFSIASEMLKRADDADELIHRIQQLKQFIGERHLDLDQVLLNHLSFILENFEITKNNESQVDIIIQNVQDIELKARGTVELLHNSKKPIPSIFIKILEQSLIYPTTYKDQLLTQQRLVEFWQINAKYSTNDILVTDKFQTTAFLFHVLSFTNQTVLQDALKISNVFP